MFKRPKITQKTHPQKAVGIFLKLIFSFVVPLPEDGDPMLVLVLDRLAVRGERADVGEHRSIHQVAKDEVDKERDDQFDPRNVHKGADDHAHIVRLLEQR